MGWLSTVLAPFRTRAAPPARATPWPLPAFDAASGTRWAGTQLTGGSLNFIAIRDKARYAAGNSPPVAAGVEAWLSRAVGAGITPKPDLPDADLQAEIAVRFDAWCDRCDIDGLGDFYSLQNRAFRPVVVEGESLIEMRAENGELRLRILPADRLDYALTRNLDGGGQIINGVELDADGRRVAFHILTDRMNFRTVRVPADQICHVFKCVYPGQQQWGISTPQASAAHASPINTSMRSGV
jgi:capsid protein